MDYESESSSPSRAGTREPRRSARTASGHDRSRTGAPPVEFFKLLLREQSEIQDLRRKLQDMLFQLHEETRRADNAERTARETVNRFKEARDLRLSAQLEATRLQEELRLYKMQLETAQREIRRGQELLDAVESQRHEAEESAARARSTARKYKEEKMMLVARQEGREEGIREGIKRGRMLGYEDGRNAGYESGWAAAAKYFEKHSVADVSIDDRSPLPVSLNEFPLPPEPEANIRIYPPGSPQEPDTRPEELPMPEPIREVEVPMDVSRPPSVRSGRSATSVPHSPVQYLLDGLIPSLDENQRINLPAPHGMTPAPPTPEATPPTSRRTATIPLVGSPPLMIPPPLEKTPSVTVSDSDTASIRSTARRPKRRRSSGDSQSTTFSQFALVGPPVASSARTNTAASPSVLSAIIEERERSPSMASSMRRPMQSPSGSLPVEMPAPRPAQSLTNLAGIGTPQASQQDYLSPNIVSVSRSSSSGIPERQSLSPNGSIASSVGYHQIVIEPPSRPESWRSAGAPETGGLLSPRDADNPLPIVPSTSPPASQPPQMIQQLPPGFVPSGSGAVTGSTPAPPSIPSAPSPGLQPFASGSTPHSEPIPVIPVPSPAAQGRRYTRAESVSDDSSTSSSAGTLTTPPHLRKRLPPSAIYASVPASSSSTAVYAAAADIGSIHPDRVPLPASTADSSGTGPGTGASAAARVPLPPSSVGSPRSVHTRMSHRTGYGSAVAP